MDGARLMDRLSASQRIATLAVLSAMALAVLDSGIVNLALPALSARFRAAPSDTILIVSAYQAALLVGLLPCAHIADRFGARRIFSGGIGLFCGAGLLCAFAPSLPLLVAARIVQGLGAAAIMALGVALLRAALGGERLGSAITWIALTVALSSAAGPAIGATILSIASWPWLFLAGLPLGAAALLAARALPEGPATRDVVDTAAIALHAATVILLVVAARVAATHGALAMMLACSAVPFLAFLVRSARGQTAPMLPADLLGRRPFAVQVGASVCCFIGQSIGLVALPFHLQTALGHDLLATGLIVTCWPIGVAATSLVAGRTMRGVDPEVQCGAGGAVLAAGLLLSASSPPQGGVVAMAAGAALCGVGFGLFQLANNRILFLAAPFERAPAAGGIQGTARLAGQTTGTLILTLVFAWGQSALAPRAGLAIGAVFALAAALIAAWGGGAVTDERSRAIEGVG
jgi:DHA2 family multidrug resistance protein-like MFS transporter